MKPFAVIMLLASACWPSTAGAYWQRSHWAACSEAPTEAERVRLNCYIFAPAYDWPLDYGRPLDAFQGSAPPPQPRFRK